MGITTKYDFSDELQAVTGKKKGTRGDAIKWAWEFIRENCDKEGASYICEDADLKLIVGKKKFKSTDVMKGISAHLE